MAVSLTKRTTRYGWTTPDRGGYAADAYTPTEAAALLLELAEMSLQRADADEAEAWFVVCEALDTLYVRPREAWTIPTPVGMFWAETFAA